MSIDEQQLTGRVAVVTGGSRGIGRGIAELLAERGAAVAVAYRERADAASSLVSMIQSNGGRAWAGQCDVTSEPSVTAFFEAVTREVGPVDILVNNAGIARDTHFMLMDAPRWHDVLATNLDSAVLLHPRRRAGHAPAGVGSHRQRQLAQRADAACAGRPTTRRRKPASRGSRARCRAIWPARECWSTPSVPG